MLDRLKPVGVQALVSQSSVEALYAPVLHGPARLNVPQLNPPFLAPAQEMAAGELRTVVAAQALRQPALLNDPLQHACHPSAG